MHLAAVIFDFDGVVIDSHDTHERSWFALADELGQPFTRETFDATFGQRNESILPLLGWAEEGDKARIRQLGDRKESLYREILRKEGIEPLPGVGALLEDLRAQGIPCAIGTSTPRANVDCVLGITGLAGLFRAVAAAEDVSRGKPDPEVFLKAAEKLGVQPSACVVIEDAQVGIRAAKAAGMKALAVTTTHPAEALAPEMPDRIEASLVPVDAVSLRGLWRRVSRRRNSPPAIYPAALPLTPPDRPNDIAEKSFIFAFPRLPRLPNSFTSLPFCESPFHDLKYQPH
jgi:beta-phosphoglucomutase family hydrolase